MLQHIIAPANLPWLGITRGGSLSVAEHRPELGTRVGVSCFVFDSDRSLSFVFELEVTALTLSADSAHII